MVVVAEGRAPRDGFWRLASPPVLARAFGAACAFGAPDSSVGRRAAPWCREHADRRERVAVRGCRGARPVGEDRSNEKQSQQ